MICCKIIADYNSKNGHFNKLLNLLSEKGDCLWENNYLFFGSIDKTISEKQVKQILNKSGYHQSYLEIYNQNNQPRENDNINGWLIDRLMKINYQLCEQENQTAFRNISHGLDLLDQEIERLNKVKQKLIKKKEAKQNGDK